MPSWSNDFINEILWSTFFFIETVKVRKHTQGQQKEQFFESCNAFWVLGPPGILDSGHYLRSHEFWVCIGPSVLPTESWVISKGIWVLGHHFQVRQNVFMLLVNAEARTSSTTVTEISFSFIFCVFAQEFQ